VVGEGRIFKRRRIQFGPGGMIAALGDLSVEVQQPGVQDVGDVLADVRPLAHQFGDVFQHAGDGRIACRPEGAADFANACLLERTGETLTLRKPDGGFRRLIVTTDGRGVAAADGAEPAQVRVIGEGRIEVTIGGDAFRLPATVRAP